MTRTLFLLTISASILVALTALTIRWELAYPGVTLFLTADGHPDGYLFNTVSVSHALLCFLAVLLLGTMMTSAARTRGAPLAGVFTWVGIALAVAIIIPFILVLLPPVGGYAAPSGASVGWTLYPPLSTTHTSLLTQLFPYVDPLMFGYLTSLVALPANALLYLGVYAMLSTLPKMRALAYVGIATVAAAVVLTTNIMRGIDTPFEAAWIVALVAPFLVCALYYMRNHRPAWLVVLTFGMVVTTLTPTVLMNLNGTQFINRDTMSLLALQYLFPMGLGWFALPAVILYQSPNRLPVWAIAALIITITVALASWIFPMFRLGLMGQPTRYSDYPDPFAAANLVVTIGVATFAAVYTATIVILLRARA